MGLAEAFNYRKPRASDLPIVKSSWIRNFREHGPAAKLIPSDSYSRGQDHLANRLLERSTVTIVVSPSDDDAVIGWAAIEGLAVHYVWIQKSAQRQGICRRLLAGLLGSRWWYTHLTEQGQGAARRLGGIYDPFLVFD